MEGKEGERRRERGVVQDLLVTEPSLAQLGLLALSALPSLPATTWNVRRLMVRTSRQGRLQGSRPGRRLAAEEQDATLCEAAEDGPC